ncbi:hypothetical protein V6917_21640 [Pectobacterium brasiliense]
MRKGGCDFKHTGIETERSKLQQAAVAGDIEGIRQCINQITQITMLNHDPFGFTRGARGVDDIRQMMWRQAKRLRCRVTVWCLVRDSGWQIIEFDSGQRAIQQGDQIGLRQQRNRGGILQHVSQTIDRIRGIQRHIGGTGFEGAEQTNNHLQTAFDANRNPIVRLYAERKQMMGETVGAAVELIVIEGMFAEYDRNGIWRLACRVFNTFVNQRVRQAIRASGIKVSQQLLTF